MDNDMLNIPGVPIAMTEPERFRAVAGLLAAAILRLHQRTALGSVQPQESAASSEKELERVAA